MTVRALEILPGNAGILQTVGRMRDLIVAPDSAVLAQADAIRLAAGGGNFWKPRAFTPPSSFALALAVFSWVQSHLVYAHDNEASDSIMPYSEAEELRSPGYLLAGIANFGRAHGDCDDFVILMAALLRALGIPATIVLTSAREDGEYDHVFLKVLTDRGWIYADAIRGDGFGWSVPAEAVTNSQEIPIAA